ncbi:MAG: PEGA domain-containing protein, partial [Myxococcota bacterium]
MVVALLLAGLARAEDVYVSSNVKGAAILLNGVDTGLVTPATVAGVAPGTVLIAVEGACARGETLIDVKRGTPTRASVLAHEMMGTLTVQPKPLQAELELDGKPYPGAPGTPVALECGSHALRASLDGYVPAVVTIDLGMGQDLVIPLTLQKLGLATLELTVQPRNAEILLDGKRVGVDAVTLPSVYQGPHTIAAELDGYQTAKKQILVEEGQTYAFHFELERTSKKSRNSRVIQIGGAKAGTTESAGAADAVEASPAVAD